MPSSALASFLAQRAAFTTSHVGATIKVDGTERTAISVTSPRLNPQVDASTFREDRYTATIHILKSQVTAITTPAGWISITIQIPESTGYRSYKAIPDQITDDPVAAEWKIEVESI